MILVPGWTTRLLTGLAEHLAASGVGAWRTTGAYLDDEVSIVVGGLPQRPAAVVALSAYDAQDDVAVGDSTVWVQVRVRAPGDSRATQDLADAVLGAFQGLGPVDLTTGVHISVGPYRVNAAALGEDTNGRQERADNYQLVAYRPTPHRL